MRKTFTPMLLLFIMSDTYLVEDVTRAEWYICWVKDLYGNLWSDTAHICVDTGLKVAEEKVIVSGTEGEKATLAMEASANEGVEIRYQWYKETAYTYNSVQYLRFQKLEDETGNKLTIDKFENGAKYMCEAITYGEEKSTIFVLGEDDTDKDDADKDDADKDDTDKNGKVTAKAAGTADIKAKVTLNDGTAKTVTMKVTVK